MTVDMSGSNENMNAEGHEDTYNTFISLIKFGTVGVILILILMAIFLL